MKSISDALGPSIVCRKMKRTRLMRTKMDGKVRLFRTWAGIFWFVVWIRKYFSLFCIMNWHVNILVLRQWKGVTRRNKSTNPSNDFPKVNNQSWNLLNWLILTICLIFSSSTLHWKVKLVLSAVSLLFHSQMEMLRNKRKLADVIWYRQKEDFVGMTCHGTRMFPE